MKSWLRIGTAAAVLMALSALLSPVAWADAAPWQTKFQAAATPLMAMITELHNFLLIIITAIVIFVLALLIYVMVRFNAKANPVPSRTSHNTPIEIIWTVIPIVILVLIAIPSFKLLYFSDVVPQADLTVKVIGHQWYWSYEYPDNGGFAYDSMMVPDEDIQPGQVRLLEVDNRIVIPVDTTVRFELTSTDVIHSFAMPQFGIKGDANPGKLHEVWAKVTNEGIYRGQCSELCGVNHGFMPIVVEVVSKDAFAKWVKEAKTKFAAADGAAPMRVAQASGQ